MNEKLSKAIRKAAKQEGWTRQEYQAVKRTIANLFDQHGRRAFRNMLRHPGTGKEITKQLRKGRECSISTDAPAASENEKLTTECQSAIPTSKPVTVETTCSESSLVETGSISKESAGIETATQITESQT